MPPAFCSTTQLTGDEVARRAGFSNVGGLEERMKEVFGRNSSEYRTDFGTLTDQTRSAMDPKSASKSRL